MYLAKVRDVPYRRITSSLLLYGRINGRVERSEDPILLFDRPYERSDGRGENFSTKGYR